jgi:hypothetical protein
VAPFGSHGSWHGRGKSAPEATTLDARGATVSGPQGSTRRLASWADRAGARRLNPRPDAPETYAKYWEATVASDSTGVIEFSFLGISPGWHREEKNKPKQTDALDDLTPGQVRHDFRRDELGTVATDERPGPFKMP